VVDAPVQAQSIKTKRAAAGLRARQQRKSFGRAGVPGRYRRGVT